MENQTALANRPVEREGQAGDNGDNSSEETAALLVWRKFRACDRSAATGSSQRKCRTAKHPCTRSPRPKSYETKKSLKERLRQVEAEARKLRDSNEAKDKQLESKIRDSSSFALVQFPSSSSSPPCLSSMDNPVVHPHDRIGALPSATDNSNLERQQQQQLGANLAPHGYPYPSHPQHGHGHIQPVSTVRADLVLSAALMIRVSSPGDTNTNINSSGGGGGNALVRMQDLGIASPVVGSGEGAGAAAVDGDGDGGGGRKRAMIDIVFFSFGCLYIV
ncbi:hypothetical protein FQN52_002184 [Onygenales sp. PD_12]|nr:hypothetical protein FQN52_002184 [Onygenales sp. PD_12]